MGNASTRKLSPQTIKQLQEHIDVDFTANELEDWYFDYAKHLEPKETGLSRTAFIKVYNSLFDGDASEFAGQVFRTFDTDQNNKVDFKEFILGLCMSDSKDPQSKLKWAFKMYDIDQNGYITKDEMNHILKAICKMTNSKRVGEFETPEQMTRKIFKELDKNRDNQISMQEFLEGAQNHPVIFEILQCGPTSE